MKYSYAAVSDVGKREINEDALEVRAGRCYLAVSYTHLRGHET